MTRKYDGIRFGTVHSFQDLGLIMTAPPDYGEPEAKTYGVDIPGSDGILDLTEATVGEVKYSNRTLTFRFAKRTADAPGTLSEVRRLLHGKRLEIVPDEDADHYYEGRVRVEESGRSRGSVEILITVDALPYKMNRRVTKMQVSSDNLGSASIKFPEGTSHYFFGTWLYFGTQYVPEGDFSIFSSLTFDWSDEQGASISDPSIKLYDASGNTYSVSIPNPAAGRQVIQTSTAGASVDLSKIWKIGMRGVWRGTVSGDLSNAKKFTLRNEMRRVIPSITLQPSAGGYLYVDGQTFTLAAGTQQIDALTLGAGEAEVLYFQSDQTARTLTIEYREGTI